MIKRVLSGPLWFLATWTLYNLAATILGAPLAVGPIIGLVIGALVVLDPGNLIWTPVQRRPAAATLAQPVLATTRARTAD